MSLPERAQQSTSLPALRHVFSQLHPQYSPALFAFLQMQRQSYEESKSTSYIFWYTNEHGKRCKSNTPGSSMTKRATEYDSFGFFGPAYSNQPTVITTGGSTPLILVHPPPCGEQSSADLDATLYVVIGERIRHEKKLNWERRRKTRAKTELVVAEQDQLQVPPQQFTRKVRNKYADDAEERRVKRLQKILRQDTIDTLSDAGSDTASETSDATSDDEESVAFERSDSNHRDGGRHQPKLHLVPTQVKNFADLISLIMAVMLGYMWVLFV